jgi:hypothetical protein
MRKISKEKGRRAAKQFRKRMMKKLKAEARKKLKKHDEIRPWQKYKMGQYKVKCSLI